MHKFTGTLLFFGMMYLAMITGGVGFGTYFDMPSLIITLGITFSLTYARHGMIEFATLNQSVLNSVINFSLISGGIGTLMGLVAMLKNMSDPSSIGPAMAVSLLTAFYSLVIAGCAYVFMKKDSVKIGITAASSSVLSLFSFFLLLLSFAKY